MALAFYGSPTTPEMLPYLTAAAIISALLGKICGGTAFTFTLAAAPWLDTIRNRQPAPEPADSAY